MSNKIPTTEELFKKYSNLYQFEEGDPEYLIDKEDFKNSMIEFAKLHIQAALQEASVYGYLRENTFGPEDIKNCYPIDNIK